jgi:cytochrome c oxidase subunit 3
MEDIELTWYPDSMLYWATRRYNARKSVLYGLHYTILLGMFFSLIQLYEYTHAAFSIDTTAYGSTFYILTGFHGLHVLVGTLFLLVCL